ncbi:CAP domain-containing protein [Labilibaculum sp. K2S]|uniref:CAP domain-containing protein n=1 Tax=Labilibaculum sp. K2S TaxID=3056386 RepID=UPI0025A47790|nr:CAP domain-containing protein [Labilibaculum sp. K2S]MDM8158730.1 CAP domain-containing protein [Labilibaculum sp. K2S]
MNKTFFSASMILLLSGIFISCSKTDIDSNDPITENNIDTQKLLDLVNDVRSTGTTCGTTYYSPVDAIVWNCKLEKAALKHSKDMMDNNFFSHTSSNGDKFVDRLNDAGYSYNKAGENIALGYSSEESVINGWLTSQGHCANIMNPNFTEMGVGRIGDYWTQDFGKTKE